MPGGIHSGGSGCAHYEYMDGWMDGQTDGWVHGWVDGWTNRPRDEWVVGGWMDSWVSGGVVRHMDKEE